MVAARLETGQQALLQEITVRVAPRLSLSARSRMTALPLSQSRHVMTEDEAVKCLEGANAEFGTSASRAREAGAMSRARALHAMARLPRHGRFAEHQSDQRRASDHAARDSQLLQGRKAVPRAREPGAGARRRRAAPHRFTRARARAGERSGREGSQHPLAVVVRDRASLGSASRALLTRTPRRARVPAGRLICLTTPSK